MYIFLYALLHSINSYSQDTFIVYGKKSYSLNTLNPNKLNQLEQNEISKLENIDALFSRTTGYNLVNNGGTRSIYFRGTDSSHLTLIKDGLIFNDSINPNRQVDFNQISLNSIKSTELIAGAESSFFGSNSIGGVLILTSGKKENSIQLKHGSFDKNSINLNLHNSNKFGDFYLNSNYETKFNYSQVTENGITNDFDPQKTINNNLKWESTKASSNQLKITFDQFYSFQNLDNGAMDDDPNDSILNKFWQFGANYHFEYDNSNKWHATFGFKKSNREFKDLPDNFESSNNSTLTSSKLGQFNLINTKVASTNLIFNTQFNFLNETLNQYKMSTLALSELAQFFLDKHLFQAGVRIDYSESNYEKISFKGSWDYNINESSQLFYSISTGFKAPTLSQLKDPTYGNKNLLPENSLTNEIGAQYGNREKLSIQISTFLTNVNDLISFHPTTYQSINDGKVEIKGAEFSIQNNLEYIKHSHIINYINSINKISGVQLNRRPHLQLTNNFDYIISENAYLQLSHNFKSKSYDTFNSNRKILNERHLFNLNAHCKSNEKTEIELNLENILNKKYQDVFGYNSAGTNFIISAKYLF